MTMHYLKPLITQLLTNNTLISKAQGLSSDEALLTYLKSHVPFADIAKAFEHYYGVQLVDLSHFQLTEDMLDIFDGNVLKSYFVLPYKYDTTTKTYFFAVNDILDDALRQNITRSCKNAGAKARFGFAPKESITRQYDTMNNKATASPSPQPSQSAAAKEQPTSEEDVNAQEWVDNVINKAIQLGASDIHIERLEFSLQVRYRVDGVMTEKSTYSYSDGTISTLFVRLKVISGMDISEKRKPQDGRIENYTFDGKTFDLRISTVTTVYGQKAVMRLLNKSNTTLTFEQLGFSESDTSKVKGMLGHKNGIIYIGGATGSGKTTSLYTMINELNDASVNMYTIENPVEKSVPNVNQIQIDPLAGITFPSTLRALLRQDPDIIVVGEIRDTETAELSVRASLTGHLVLSTIHANSALDSINRLLNMGVEPYLIVGSSLGFLSQRLVRKLCTHCAIPNNDLSLTEEAWLSDKEKEFGVDIDRSSLHKAQGCEHCTEGYKGRVAVVEIIEMTEGMKSLIVQKANLQALREQALKDGFNPLTLNGVKKAAQGLTTIEELIRELT